MERDYLTTAKQIQREKNKNGIHNIEVFLKQTFKFANENQLKTIVCLSNYMYRLCIRYAKKNNINLNIINANDKEQIQSFIYNYRVSRLGRSSFDSSLYLFVIDTSFEMLDINFYLDYIIDKIKDKCINENFDDQYIRKDFISKFKLLVYCENFDSVQFLKHSYWDRKIGFFECDFNIGYSSDYWNYKTSFFPMIFEYPDKEVNKTINLIREYIKPNLFSLTKFLEDYKSESKQRIRNKIYSIVYNYFQKDFDYLDATASNMNPDYSCQKKVAFMKLDKLIFEIIENIGDNANADIYNQILFSLLVMENANMIEIHNNGDIFGYSDDGIYVRIKPLSASLCTTKYKNPQVMEVVLDKIYGSKAPLQVEYREQYLRDVNTKFNLELSNEQMLEILFNSDQTAFCPKYKKIFYTNFLGIRDFELKLIDALINNELIPGISHDEIETEKLSLSLNALKINNYCEKALKELPKDFNPQKTELSKKVLQKINNRHNRRY